MIDIKYDLYILSNHVPELPRLIENLNLSKYFKRIYTSGNMNYEKPHAEFYNYVLNDIEINSEKAIMIGDSYNSDYNGAQNVGIKSILIRSQNNNCIERYAENFYNVPKIINDIQLTTAST